MEKLTTQFEFVSISIWIIFEINIFGSLFCAYKSINYF